MQIIEINGFDAHCETGGIYRQVSLFMLQHESVQVGDFIMVHVGYAIQKIGAEEAMACQVIYNEMQQ